MTVVETLPGSGRPATAAPTAGPRSAIRSEARSDADRREPSPSGYLQRSHHARDTAGSDWRFRSRRERAVRRARDRSLKRSVAPRRQVAVAVETTIRLPIPSRGGWHQTPARAECDGRVPKTAASDPDASLVRSREGRRAQGAPTARFRLRAEEKGPTAPTDFSDGAKGWFSVRGPHQLERTLLSAVPSNDRCTWLVRLVYLRP